MGNNVKIHITRIFGHNFKGQLCIARKTLPAQSSKNTSCRSTLRLAGMREIILGRCSLLPRNISFSASLTFLGAVEGGDRKCRGLQGYYSWGFVGRSLSAHVSDMCLNSGRPRGCYYRTTVSSLFSFFSSFE